MRCKAAIVPQMGGDIIVEEVELDEPGYREVRIKIMTCTICHSDIHALLGEHGAYEGPGIAGHEIAGVVDKCGGGVTYVRPGDRVLCTEVRAGCGQCEPCLKGHPWFCENIPPMSFRVPSPYSRLDGTRVTQTCSGASGFAEYTNAHEAMLVKLDDDIPFEIGSALACGFMSGFGAVLNRCQIKPGESFVVVGAGGVGLSAIMGAKLSGANPVIAVDTMDVKLEAAKKFGATHTVNPKMCDAVAEVKRITRGYGCDHSLVAVAARGVKRTAFDMTAGWGQVTIVGHQLPENEGLGDINAVELLFGKRLTGSVMGAVNLRRDIPAYMDMYRRGMIDIDALLSNRFPLGEIKAALDDSLHGALKNVVTIHD
ncbi:MAG: alcohol dehydrogenase catalytic domain-containing protein [Oscillospiraceae bacterium]|jgi:Zn-dependent alcohol dehydrogenase|nr:alcohol dehydrogenase catalytic domain-containing protein [Oscillospiraceae bacterium]